MYFEMKDRTNISFSSLVIAVVMAAALVSCSKFGDEFNHIGDKGANPGTRIPSEEQRNVLILYSAGYNSISSYLKEDIEDLMKGWLPEGDRNENILLVYSHQTAKRSDYITDNPPTLTRLWQSLEGEVMADTLMTYPSGTRSATAPQLNDVLSFVHDNFPAKSYGMIFSSHATGYLPAGYYTKPDKYVFQPQARTFDADRIWAPSPVPFIAPEYDPGMPAVKSIGQDQVGTGTGSVSYEMEIGDFAKALPMNFEYILFDACLMGGVEVAYELKEKCRYVGFSQAEVLAEGFDYTTLTTHLLKTGTPDPEAVCDDYFQQYDIQSGVYRSATISMIDCTRMKKLAETCKTLFGKYRMEIALLNPSDVQRFFRSDYHWFYDLQDILIKAGATDQELMELEAALGECVIYKAATPSFMGSFDIKTFSGFSMYLPCNGDKELDKYYMTLSWNKDTGLVE